MPPQTETAILAGGCFWRMRTRCDTFPGAAGHLVAVVYRAQSKMNSNIEQETQYMPRKPPPLKDNATAADIERSIQALNRMAERLWGEGREAEAKALLDALDALNRALDRIRIGESRRAATLH
jgi:hypothetical protein